MAGKKNLFSEFPHVSREEWEAKILEDLRGAPYAKLISKTIEGIEIKPYYHQDDNAHLEYLNTLPGEFPYHRSEKIQLNEWEIRQDILVREVEKSNKTALLALNRGAGSIAFNLDKNLKLDQKKFSKLLNGIFFDCININFSIADQAGQIYNLLLTEAEAKKMDSEKIFGSLNSDFLGNLSVSGGLTNSLDHAFDSLSERIKKSNATTPLFRQLVINADIFHNAGASAVQELGYGLSMLTEYLHQLTERGLKIDSLASQVVMNFATGSSYFMEIAKFRAARLLFANLISSFKPASENAGKLIIHATSSEWNQSLYDPYVNMLRGTTENMSAVLGNVDSFSVTPFDKSFREPTAFSERIARNTQIILKEEAHLDKIVDPGAGSYYIESLTDSVAEEAWKIFLDIESKGGYLEALKNGIIQDNIKETALARDINIATRREILLGINQYANPNELLDDQIKSGFIKERKGPPLKTDIKALKKYRGAEAFEEIRIKTEQSGKTPVVFLLNVGNPTWRKARASFSAGYFACAGYKIIDNNGFESLEEGLKAVKKASPDIIVLCSSDEEYPEFAKETISKLEKGKILVIAGYPKESLDDLKKMGIEYFIHLKSNILEELKEFNSSWV